MGLAKQLPSMMIVCMERIAISTQASALCKLAGIWVPAAILADEVPGCEAGRKAPQVRQLPHLMVDCTTSLFKPDARQCVPWIKLVGL